MQVFYDEVPLTVLECDGLDREFGKYLRTTADVVIFGRDAQREIEVPGWMKATRISRH